MTASLFAPSCQEPPVPPLGPQPAADLARFDPDGVTPQVVHHTDEHTVVVAALEDGQAIAPHAPPVSVTIVATDGVGDVMTDDGAQPVHAGDVVVIPAGGLRGVRARGGRLVAVLTVAPPPTAADHAPAAEAPAWPDPRPADPDVAATIAAEHQPLHQQTADLAELAEAVDRLDAAEFADRLQQAVGVLRDELMPHAAVDDAALYPTIDRLLASTRQGTATMSRDHQAIGERVDQLTALADAVVDSGYAIASPTAARRLLFELYALLEVHLAKKEQVYLPLLSRLTTDEQQAVLKRLHHAHTTPPTPTGQR